MTQNIKNLITYNRQVKSRLNASNVPHGTYYWLLAIFTATERLGHAPCSSELGEEMNLSATPHITKIGDHGLAVISKAKVRNVEKNVFTLTQDGLNVLESIVGGSVS